MVSDRNARLVRKYNGAYESMSLCYSIKTTEGIIYVKEEYKTKYYNTGGATLKESETVPEEVYLFINEGDAYFYGSFYGWEERPSMEWLTSFGTKKLPDVTGHKTLSDASWIALTGACVVVLAAVAFGGVIVIKNKRKKSTVPEAAVEEPDSNTGV